MSEKKELSNFEVMRTIRDSHAVRNAPRQLLDALGLRCRPREGFKAWPSYRQLGLDTGLDPMTLKRAAKKLEEAKLIKRVVRPNRSTLFFLNISLLQELAEESRKADDERKRAEEAKTSAAFETESPFPEPDIDENSCSDDDDDDENVGGAPWRQA
jgi:DNA-binding MarR family transcriptional regulator